MEFEKVMQQLKTLGTEQNRKIYARHGVHGDQFGLSFADLGKMAKQIKLDHNLAVQLWESGNHDAHLLAVRVADPVRLDEATAEKWAASLDNYIITDAFSDFVSRSVLAPHLASIWRDQEAEWISTAGWNITARLPMDEKTEDQQFMQILGDIERNIHAAKNRTRYAMNNALIAIGIRNTRLRDRAIQAARKIGKVEVDHGKTGCKTPDAEAYILKTLAHRTRRNQ